MPLARTALAVSVALGLLVTTPGCKKGGGASDTGAAHDPTAWEDLKSDEGGFTVRMVKGAKASKESVQSPIGPLETRTWIGEDEAKMYFVSFTVYPSALPNVEGALDGARDGAAKNISGKVLQEKKLKVGEHSARDLIISAESKGKPVTVRARLALTGTRLYMLQVIVPEAATTADDADATRFFDSFKLKPG
jgi:hypothetical protein